jgi:hypothetical protein
MRPFALAVALLCAALLAAGCGGGGSAGSSSTAPVESGGEVNEGGAPKKATAPNAPTGSKVVACKEGAADMEALRAAAVNCASARAAMRNWGRSRVCALGEGDSRGSCSLGAFRCQAVRTDRGAAVSCARPGGDVAFVAKAWPVKRSGG